MTSAITHATTTATAAGSAASTAAVKIGGDFQTFLKMLTTQLQNQDPTNAMDPTEMTNQLVAFSQVEQQIDMNSNLNKLIDLQQTQALTSAAPLVGKSVELSGTQLALQNGSASLNLPVAGTATAAHIQVQDAGGNVLYDTTTPLRGSASTWTWNGQTTGGRQLPDGGYTYVVQGVTGNGSAVAMTATSNATVTGVERNNNDLQLAVGKLTVPFSTINRVNE